MKGRASVCFKITGYILCSIFLFQESFAQGIHFHGFVFTSDGKPASDIVLSLANRYQATSDSAGYFYFSDVTPGNYTVSLKVNNIIVQDTSIVLEKDTMLSFSFNRFSFRRLRELLVMDDAAKYVFLNTSPNMRLDRNLLEVPQNIAIVSRQHIKETGALSLDDMIATVSGSLPYNAGGQNMGILMRGFSSNYNIMRNGIGAGYFFNQAPDANAIERIEYIKGPAGFLISNADPIGMINVVTRQPVGKPLANIEMGYGSWNMMRLSFDVGGPLTQSGALTYRLNAAVQDQQQPYQYGYLKKQFAAAAIRYDFDKNTSVTAEYNYGRGKGLEDVHYVPTVNSRFFAVPRNFTVTDPNMQGVLTYDHYLRFNFLHRIDTNWTINGQAGQVTGAWKSDAMVVNRDLAVSNDTIYRNISRDDAYNKLYTASAFLQGHFSTGSPFRHVLLAGIDYGRSQVDDVFDIAGDRLPLYYKQPAYFIPQDSLAAIANSNAQISYQPRSYYAAFYLQDQVKVYNNFVLDVALRYTYAYASSNISPTYFAPAAQSDKKVTPRFGLTYLFNEDIAFYGLYDVAFKPQLGVTYSGKPYAPVTGSNIEAGIKSHWFDKKLVANLTFYTTKRRNVLINDILNPGFKIETGEQVSKGIEFDLNGQLTPEVNIIANYAYTDTRISQSNDSRVPVGLFNIGTPVHSSFFVFAKYQFSMPLLENLWLGAGMQYVGKSNTSTSRNEFVNGYSLLQAAAGYAWKQFYAKLNIYNLTDKQYAINAQKISDKEWIYKPGQPANFRLTLVYNL